MRYQDLLEILANPENSKVEFKRDDIRPEQLAKEIVAFTNFRGGQVFLGIDDTTRGTWLVFSNRLKVEIF